jgi:lipopolysaccharide biosynthesis glycosyltransferase
MDIVFSINRTGLEGLGATLTSLIRNCSDSFCLNLWFLCSELFLSDKDNIYTLLKQENFKGKAEFINFNAKQTFGHLRALHGDWTTYGRLLIPDVLEKEIVLYLDSDLIITKDILLLKSFYSDMPLSAVRGCNVKWSLESSFFINELKWVPTTNYFNAGVLLYNIKTWKEKNINKKIEDISLKYPNEFLSADQTLLNAAFEGNFGLLPQTFNSSWNPGQIKFLVDDTAIIHFVGSPKPWDIFGKIVHHGYNTWSAYNTSFWKSKYGKINKDKIKRAWRIRRSIAKSFKLRFLPARSTALAN